MYMKNAREKNVYLGSWNLKTSDIHYTVTASQTKGPTADKGLEGIGGICRNTEGLSKAFCDESAYVLYHAEKR